MTETVYTVHLTETLTVQTRSATVAELESEEGEKVTAETGEF